MSDLPYGWTDSDLLVLLDMASNLGVDPLDVLAIFYSESSARPHIRSGLGQLMPIIEVEMGWAPGTIDALVDGPISEQLAAIADFWNHNQQKYVKTSYVEKARQWGVSAPTALYSYHIFLNASRAATGPNSVLADSVSDAGKTYSGNSGLDIGGKGRITVADIQSRINNKRNEIGRDPLISQVRDRLIALEGGGASTRASDGLAGLAGTFNLLPLVAGLAIAGMSALYLFRGKFFPSRN